MDFAWIRIIIITYDVARACRLLRQSHRSARRKEEKEGTNQHHGHQGRP